MNSFDESYCSTKPRPVKTIEDWTRDIDHEAAGKLGRWRFLSREIFSSAAYRALTLPEREVLHCFLNRVTYRVGKQDKRRMKSGKTAPTNGNRLIVTNGEIKARGGVKSDRTIAAARRRLVEIGFLDVVESAAFPQCGVFALSERYRAYPSGEFGPPAAAKPVAYARYSRRCKAGSRRFGTGIILHDPEGGALTKTPELRAETPLVVN